MAISIFLSLLMLPATWIAWRVYDLAVNYHAVRKLGIRIIIRPIDQINPVYILIRDYALPYFERLPFGSRNFTCFC
jgi:hypothetical protein